MSLIRISLILSLVAMGPSLVYAWPFAQQPEPSCSIMLDPAGDAHHTGRKLDDSFERGITLQCVEQLKMILEEQHPGIRVIITRFPGEAVQPLQNANFANRLDVDFYVSVNFYHEQATKPNLSLYQFSYGDDFVSAVTDMAFYPYDKAHLLNGTRTKQWALMMQEILQSDIYTTQFDVHGVYKIPFKPLIGIKSPAVAFEVGLKTKDDWHHYALAFADSLRPVIVAIKNKKTLTP